MAKNMPKIANVSIFCHFLAPYRQQNFIKAFLSCRGGSELRFGGSYVKIGYNLASGMSFKDLQVKMRLI